MNRVRLPGWEGPVLNAAIWLRQHLDIPKYENIEPVFSKYFNCVVIQEFDPDNHFTFKVYVEFDEPAATMFILRWS